jgi:hypothetical protein
MGVRIPLPLLRAFSSVEPEHHPAKVEAGGSSPPTLTITGVPGSSSGRTWAFEARERGSNPCPGACAGEAPVAVRLFRKEDSGGSTPSTGSTLSWCVRSEARTPDCQSGGDEFESRTHRHLGMAQRSAYSAWNRVVGSSNLSAQTNMGAIRQDQGTVSKTVRTLRRTGGSRPPASSRGTA